MPKILLVPSFPDTVYIVILNVWDLKFVFKHAMHAVQSAVLLQ